VPLNSSLQANVQPAAAALTVSPNVAAALTELVSITLIVRLELPAAVGVPEMTPVEEFSVNPAGNTPVVTDQV